MYRERERGEGQRKINGKRGRAEDCRGYEYKWYGLGGGGFRKTRIAGE